MPTEVGCPMLKLKLFFQLKIATLYKPFILSPRFLSLMTTDFSYPVLREHNRQLLDEVFVISRIIKV